MIFCLTGCTLPGANLKYVLETLNPILQPKTRNTIKRNLHGLISVDPTIFVIFFLSQFDTNLFLISFRPNLANIILFLVEKNKYFED